MKLHAICQVLKVVEVLRIFWHNFFSEEFRIRNQYWLKKYWLQVFLEVIVTSGCFEDAVYADFNFAHKIQVIRVVRVGQNPTANCFGLIVNIVIDIVSEKYL